MTERQTNGLREWREQHGFRLEEVADLVGRSASFLSRVERGERRLRPFDRIHIARKLGVRVGILFPPEKAIAG